MQTIVAAIYIKVSSSSVAETEVAELLKQLAGNGCYLASEEAVKELTDFNEERDSLTEWVGTGNYDMVCIRRSVNLDSRDAYLTFIQNLYCGNIALLGLK